MAHSQGHICQCLGRIQYLRRDSPLCITADRRRSGVEFVDGVISLACGLSELGIRRGEVIAIAALNSDLYMEWFLAITYVGGIVAPLNYRWSFEEAKSALEIVSPVMLVLDESCISWALQLQMNMDISSLKLYAFIGDPSSSSLGRTENVLSMNAIRRHSQSIEALDISWAPKEIALICFTSGTTGRPKGVAISHTALIIQSLAKIAIVGYGENDVYLHTAPLCHIGGISSCVAMLMAGGCHVFVPKFDAKSSFTAIKQHQVTSLITVPAMMADLVSYARNANVLSGGDTVNKILNGAGGLSSKLVNLATSIFPHAKILSAYGMTETCSSLTFITLRDPDPKEPRMVHSTTNDSKNGGVLVGKPAPHIELRISSGSDYPLVGSILTRGSHVMVGYCSQSMNIMLDSVEHGWLDTGDIGRIDGNGDLWLIGRKKDRIKSGGENVYPEEVEALLRQHPGIIDAVVISIPDIRLNEKVIACISLRDDWNWIDQSLSHSQGAKKLSSEILLTYCRQRNLTRYKIPKIFIPWWKPFPLTTTGKLKRDELRREALSYLQLLSSRL